MFTSASTPTRHRQSHFHEHGTNRIQAPEFTSLAKEAMADRVGEPMSWEILIPAIFDRGERVEDDPSLASLVFPRAENQKHEALHYEALPAWHRALIDRITESDTWMSFKEVYQSALGEVAMYSNIISILDLIKVMTGDCTESAAAVATSDITFFDTHLRNLARSGGVEGPNVKPDISGVFGVRSTTRSEKLAYGLEESGCVSTSARSVLVPIEVELIRPPTQKKRNGPLDEDEESFDLVDLLPDGRLVPRQPRSGRATSTSDSAKHPGTSKDRLSSTISKSLEPRTQAMGDLKPKSSPKISLHSRTSSPHLVPSQAPPMTLSPSIPDLVQSIQHPTPSYTPYNKMIQLIHYLAAAREEQPFRSSAFGIVIQNTQAKLVYCDAAGTVHHAGVDIFKEAHLFISLIVFILQADWPAFGWDPIWVSQKRISRLHESGLGVYQDPRRIKNRPLRLPMTFPTSPDTPLIKYYYRAGLVRRLSIHGRGTTVIIVLPLSLPNTVASQELYASPELECLVPDVLPPSEPLILKHSFIVIGRTKEASFYSHAEQELGPAQRVRVLYSVEEDMTFWTTLRALGGPAPLETREARILIMTPRCHLLQQVATPREVLHLFIGAIKRKYIHGF